VDSGTAQVPPRCLALAQQSNSCCRLWCNIAYGELLAWLGVRAIAVHTLRVNLLYLEVASGQREGSLGPAMNQFIQSLVR
jgi:hypothetical protein